MFVHKLSVNAIFKEYPERFGEKAFKLAPWELVRSAIIAQN
jgi:hypothetical protein